VGFDIADNHIHAFFTPLVSGFEHGIGLTDSSGIAEKYLESPAMASVFIRLNLSEELIRVGAGIFYGHGLSDQENFNSFYPIQRQI
jgi:hypothetical protein